VTFSAKGFGLTIGSDLSILFVNHKHYNSLGVIKSGLKADVIHGTFTAHNASNSTSELSFAGTFGFINATNSHVSRGKFVRTFSMQLVLNQPTHRASARMLPRPRLAVVPPAFPVVDDVLPGAPLLDLFLPLEPAVFPELAAARHDHLLLLLLHCE
jgi:hypothetical protein